jgi:hypothetical protein
MKTTAGIEYGLHARLYGKYRHARNRALHGPGSFWRRKHWAHVANAIFIRYPWAAQPPRYEIRFDRIQMPKIAGGFPTADLRAILTAEENSFMQAAGVPEPMLVYREPTPEEIAEHDRIAAWERQGKLHPGVQGRSTKITREEYLKGRTDPKILELLDKNPMATLYWYDDIRFLSGTAGYAVVLNGKCLGRQVIRMS